MRVRGWGRTLAREVHSGPACVCVCVCVCVESPREDPVGLRCGVCDGEKKRERECAHERIAVGLYESVGERLSVCVRARECVCVVECVSVVRVSVIGRECEPNPRGSQWARSRVSRWSPSTRRRPGSSRSSSARTRPGPTSRPWSGPPGSLAAALSSLGPLPKGGGRRKAERERGGGGGVRSKIE